MTLASRVFDQVDVPRLEGDLFSSRDFNLSSATECDHVLAPWAAMPIGNRTGRAATKLGPGDLHQLECLPRVSGCELHLDLFGMRLIVWPRVEPGHEHGFV